MVEKLAMCKNIGIDPWPYGHQLSWWNPIKIPGAPSPPALPVSRFLGISQQHLDQNNETKKGTATIWCIYIYYDFIIIISNITIFSIMQIYIYIYYYYFFYYYYSWFIIIIILCIYIYTYYVYIYIYILQSCV